MCLCEYVQHQQNSINQYFLRLYQNYPLKNYKNHLSCYYRRIIFASRLKFSKKTCWSLWSHPTLFRSILGIDFYYNHVFKFVNWMVSLNFCLALNMLKYTCIFEFSKTAFRSTFWKRYSTEESILNLVKYSDIKIVRKKSIQLRIENLYLWVLLA